MPKELALTRIEDPKREQCLSCMRMGSEATKESLIVKGIMVQASFFKIKIRSLVLVLCDDCLLTFESKIGQTV